MAEQTTDIVKVRELEVVKPNGLRGRFIQATLRLPDTMAGDADNYKAPFFIADRNYEIVRAVKRNEVAGGAGSTATVYVTPSGTAGGSGKSVCTFDLTTTTTLAVATLTGTLANRLLAAGESLTANAADMAACEGLTITVYLKAL
jgi:hypothetical protein